MVSYKVTDMHYVCSVLKMVYLIILSLLYCALAVSSKDDYPEVNANQGTLQGLYMTTTYGKTFSAFLGIPYAKPPVGELRFEPPQPADRWNNVFNATKPHPVCPQMLVYPYIHNATGSEDCLYLNVYTPRRSSTDKNIYPAMVFIHGGGFTSGSGQLYGPDDFLDYNVIIVTINYRIGALGFLTTGDLIVPGNNGLKDQTLALKWVNDNIKHFGGNSKNITLFGHSAGAASVHFHQFSPLSKGLFQYAISQSGTALNIWALGDKKVAVESGKRLAKALSCPTNNNSDMVKCLRKIHPYKFIEADIMFMEWEVEPLIPFKPVVEESHKTAFIDEHPVEILKAGKHYQVPWIAGGTTEEGAVRVSGLLLHPHLIKDLDTNFNRIMSIIMEGRIMDFDKLRKFYFGKKKN